MSASRSRRSKRVVVEPATPPAEALRQALASDDAPASKLAPAPAPPKPRRWIAACQLHYRSRTRGDTRAAPGDAVDPGLDDLARFKASGAIVEA